MAINFMDDQLDMMCGGLFDNIEDLLDFSTDDEALAMVDSSVAAGGQPLTPPASASFPPPVADGCRVYEDNKINDEINVGEDWITNFLDDSNFELDFPATTDAITTTTAAAENGDYINKDESLFQSFSPISVLDELSSEKGGSSSSSSSSSSASSSNNETVCLAPVGPTMVLVPARARTKRPRRPATAHVAAPIVPPASEGPPAVPTLLPECESFAESCPVPMKKKKKKGGPAAAEDGIAVQKCLHCGIQKTPQWRAGPMGPKTLCNACGVRYKSGRLFPEYRPAASPTFVPSIHSNSHKKVVEMRNKECQKKAANGMPSPEYPAAKNCDLLAYIRG